MPNLPDPVTLASSLVRIPSESSDPVGTDPAAPEREMVAYLTSLCRDAGIEYRTSEASPNRENLVIRLPKPGAPRILIAAHLDTVSGRGMQEPFGEGFAKVRSGAAAPATTRDRWPPAFRPSSTCMVTASSPLSTSPSPARSTRSAPWPGPNSWPGRSTASISA